jgi:hypothetical protein
MTLPKIELPTYEVTLPSTGEEVTIRPFTVKEEKILLMAADSGDDNYIINTTKQIINNCLITDTVKIDKLPFFDVDYLFIALRAKSIGEAIEMQFVCNAVVDEQPCKNVFYEFIDISKATINKDESISNRIQLSDKISVKMKYPTYSMMKMLGGEKAVIEKKINLIVNCIEQIVNGDKIYSYKDYSKQDLTEFVEGLTEDQFLKLCKFVENFPSFSVKLNTQCPRCNFEHYIEYDDFTSFFQ